MSLGGVGWPAVAERPAFPGNDCMQTAANRPEMLTLQEVAALLGIGLRSLNRNVQTGLFPPPIRLGRRTLRYSRRAVLAWIDEKSGRPR